MQGHGITTAKLEAVIATGEKLLETMTITRYDWQTEDAANRFRDALKALEKGMEEERGSR